MGGVRLTTGHQDQQSGLHHDVFLSSHYMVRAGPRWPKLAQAGPSWPKLAQAGPRWPVRDRQSDRLDGQDRLSNPTGLFSPQSIAGSVAWGAKLSIAVTGVETYIPHQTPRDNPRRLIELIATVAWKGAADAHHVTTGHMNRWDSSARVRSVEIVTHMGSMCAVRRTTSNWRGR